ncbi:uncharacterized protein LOC116778418 isoform X2 [Danaus plexippus]|uniref:uncharacterized protein LOC116778418 isoform X2 n=1 Tax=Danaus plexippus TaxID=13037 RepID=UPI002AB27624|nr:uncharacterized protein LOC116778418 isoform X2 [Danaus plexippus]
MGTKSTVRLRKRGKAFKCDLCGRKLMSPDALKAHQRTAHNILKVKTKQEAKPVKISKTAKPKPIKKAASPSKVAAKRSSERNIKENDKPKKTDKQDQVEKAKVQFECPSLPNSPDLIQPVRLELCQKCNRKVKSIQAHDCETNQAAEDKTRSYMCAACDEWFTNLKGFDDHVLGTHSEKESVIFPTDDEFTKWKTDMEERTSVNYTEVENSDPKRYRCNSIKEKPKRSNTSYMCPSMLVVQDISKGLEVSYYKNHHKHQFQEYNPEDYKKYLKSAVVEEEKVAEIKKEESELFVQFKTLMQGILADAEKASEATLKLLLLKAMDLSSVMHVHDEKASTYINSNQIMTDSQISEALEDTGTKRKLGHDTGDIKRPKLSCDVPSPKIVNSFSLAELDSDITESVKNTAKDQTTFNDKYKDFVVKNFPEAELKKRTRNERKIMKTKIGQYKPSISPKDIKKSIQLSIEKPRVKVDFDYEVKEQTDGCNILILKI